MKHADELKALGADVVLSSEAADIPSRVKDITSVLALLGLGFRIYP